MLKEIKAAMELMEKLKKMHQEATRILKEKEKVTGKLVVDGFEIDFIIRKVEDDGRGEGNS